MIKDNSDSNKCLINHPPKEDTYEIKLDNKSIITHSTVLKNPSVYNDIKFCRNFSKIRFKSKIAKSEGIYPNLCVEGYLLKETSLLQTKNSKNEDIIYLLYVKNVYTSENNIKLIFNHHTDTDLGQIFPILLDLCLHLKCDIISFDYKGFGVSTGQTKTLNDLSVDFETVIKFACKELKISYDKMLLFGHLYGTIPLIDIASNNIYQNFYGSSLFKGIILLSPIVKDTCKKKNKKDEKSNFDELAQPQRNLLNKNKNSKEVIEEKLYLYPYSNFIKLKNIDCRVYLFYDIKDNANTNEIIFLKSQIKFLNEISINNISDFNFYLENRESFIREIRSFLIFLSGKPVFSKRRRSLTPKGTKFKNKGNKNKEDEKKQEETINTSTDNDNQLINQTTDNEKVPREGSFSLNK